MDTPESIAIELITDAVVVAGFGASTSTSTAAVPGASAPKIGTVSTVITRYFLLRERKDGLPLGGGRCRSDRSVHSVCGLAGSGTSSKVQSQKGRRGRENLSTSSYARRPIDEEN
jgi:hypothetical protein